MPPFTQDEVIFIKNNLDKPSDWIGKQLSRSKHSINHKIKKMGCSKIYNQKKYIDKSKLLSKKELSYCLGVLASDGCITTKNNKNGSVVKRFALTLGIKDVQWLLSIFHLLTGEFVSYSTKPRQ